MNLTDRISAIKDALAANNGDGITAHLEALDNDGVLLVILYLLKEQDKKTRHACAEAVMAIDLFEGHFADFAHAREVKNRAHQACMNVQAL